MHIIQKHNTKLPTHVGIYTLELARVVPVAGTVFPQTLHVVRDEGCDSVTVKVDPVAALVAVESNPMTSWLCAVIGVCDKGRGAGPPQRNTISRVDSTRSRRYQRQNSPQFQTVHHTPRIRL